MPIDASEICRHRNPAPLTAELLSIQLGPEARDAIDFALGQFNGNWLAPERLEHLRHGPSAGDHAGRRRPHRCPETAVETPPPQHRSATFGCDSCRLLIRVKGTEFGRP